MSGLTATKLLRGFILQSLTMASIANVCTKNVHSTLTELSVTPFSIAYVTIGNESDAKVLAGKLVDKKLAACVNIMPKVLSIYEWKGKIEEDNEALMMIKTRTTMIDELISFVKANHKYEVCEVISVPIQHGNPDYLKWLSETLPEQIKEHEPST